MIPQSFYNINGAISLLVIAGTFAFFYLSGLGKKKIWTIVVTPLASIIGSGFLVVAPLLYQNFGRYHWVAIIVINMFAFAVGWVIRTNIKHFEPLLENGNRRRKLLINLERASSLILGLSYVISVGFYLSLLSSFALNALDLQSPLNVKLLTTLVLAVIGGTGFFKGLRGMEGMEKIAVRINLSIIAGLLVSLAISAVFLEVNGEMSGPQEIPNLNLDSLLLLSGMLLIVQGFETTRYLGADYTPAERARGQLLAQVIAATIYLLFVPLAAPLSGHLGDAADATAIIPIVSRAAWGLAPALSAAAIFSQFGAAVADTVGTAGILEEETKGRLRRRMGYALVTGLAVVLIWTVDLFEVLTLASRAFALYYAVQAVMASILVVETPGVLYKRFRSILFPSLAVILLLISIFAIPAH
jgi:hypothetical protein